MKQHGKRARQEGAIKHTEEKEIEILPLFATPLMQVQLDLDLEKLTEFAHELYENTNIPQPAGDPNTLDFSQSIPGKPWYQRTLQNTKISLSVPGKSSNKGGWQSNHDLNFEKLDISKENHEEFIRLKKEIHQYLQIYHTEVFRGMKFKKNVAQKLTDIWININEKYNYNEWHIHAYATLSGTYYIKHDGSIENGDISFRHPVNQLGVLHWQPDEIEACNTVTSGIVTNRPRSNMLLIFPSWLEHKVEANLKNDYRISLSFNSVVSPII